ncbi:MAG: hypothetical protein US62_C0054G0001 [Candidatus Woesebacteria bacterium GW2011_GWA1_37_8]|uniref:Uncharacterized protein n=2 Tax=Candidatus Woeseibacteriota TaxID=1752722 RepID=A0A0G0PE42_9BACT|nr:MAG: hypothetical protein US39_C0007G0025 [Microgenomates group bacterium GW2011_GWC1_37_12b]KKQ43107.1 MAG: hypothetical protein US62_C0054G0001 [Candidatus Woesebacteria bacterium GW2011_GWA1_37_8]KKQ87556.1 MAG: hypothetical protein UT10_C0004G0022 [Candidatus Woesebacteria bacterium GW2011_GWB1_38_8b]
MDGAEGLTLNEDGSHLNAAIRSSVQEIVGSEEMSPEERHTILLVV